MSNVVFEVYAGNLGCCYHGSHLRLALQAFLGWGGNSLRGVGRVAGEEVVLLVDKEEKMNITDLPAVWRTALEEACELQGASPGLEWRKCLIQAATDRGMKTGSRELEDFVTTVEDLGQ